MKKLPYILFLLLAVSVFSCSKKNISSFVMPEPENIEIEDLTDTVPNDTLRPYLSVEQMPSFPGGNAELLKFMTANLSIPDTVNISENLSSVIRFVVTKEGEIKNVEAVRNKGTALTDGLIERAKQMPRWNPGMQNGKPVDVYYNFPIHVSFER